ncbi:MAG: isochorismatase family cysteine hydrolase [Candidatus Paceibacterota bacterium]
MKINSNKNHRAVVLIDMQDFFLKHFSFSIYKDLIKNQSKVIDVCEKYNIPLIVLEYKCRGIFRGKTTDKLHKKIKNLKEAKILIKMSNSGFTDTPLDALLKESKINELVLMGINANACVQDTAIGALKRGFKVSTSQDIIANSSSGKNQILSKRNKEWYKKNTNFFINFEDFLSYIKK